jgi:hypothetical protein
MTDTDQSALIQQLQQQQSLMTQALVAALEGRWVAGADTVEAYVYALDPSRQGQLILDPPVVSS